MFEWFKKLNEPTEENIKAYEYYLKIKALKKHGTWSKKAYWSEFEIFIDGIKFTIMAEKPYILNDHKARASISFSCEGVSKTFYMHNSRASEVKEYIDRVYDNIVDEEEAILMEKVEQILAGETPKE